MRARTIPLHDATPPMPILTTRSTFEIQLLHMGEGECVSYEPENIDLFPWGADCLGKSPTPILHPGELSELRPSEGFHCTKHAHCYDLQQERIALALKWSRQDHFEVPVLPNNNGRVPVPNRKRLPSHARTPRKPTKTSRGRGFSTHTPPPCPGLHLTRRFRSSFFTLQ